MKEFVQPLLYASTLTPQVIKGDEVFVPEFCEKPHDYLAPRGHGGVEAGQGVLGHQFKHESLLFVQGFHLAADLEFVEEVADQSTVAVPGRGKLLL